MLKILLLAASVRRDSCNRRLIDLASQVYQQEHPDIELEMLHFADFLAPFYDGDLEAKMGLPQQAHQFIEKLNQAQGIVIASPEYNFSIPGTLKNLIDWVSRANPMPLAQYPIMLCSASPAMMGGNHGVMHAAFMLRFCLRANVFESIFSVGNAYEAFGSDGCLQNSFMQQKLTKTLAEFIEFIRLDHQRKNTIAE